MGLQPYVEKDADRLITVNTIKVGAGAGGEGGRYSVDWADQHDQGGGGGRRRGRAVLTGLG